LPRSTSKKSITILNNWAIKKHKQEEHHGLEPLDCQEEEQEHHIKAKARRGMTKTTSNKNIKENTSKMNILKNMRNMNIMALEQLELAKKEEQEEHCGFGTIGLPGNTNKRNITT
jgi:hypothetical protein